MKSIFQYGGKNTFEGAESDFLIELFTHKETYKLVYGLQTKYIYDYDIVSKELGYCITHYLSSEGLMID